jgi:rhodanese-related sulfurtransferase
MSMTSVLEPITPAAARQLIERNKAVLIDIREPEEHAREHIVGARLVPISGFDQHDFDRDHDKAVIVHCRSGMRTAEHAASIIARGFPRAFALEGGLEAWKKAGLPVHVDRSRPIELIRQVQIGAGALVLLGLALALAINPWFAALSAFVGAGLVFAGATGFCGMARLLAVMPWNRGVYS